MIKQIKSQTNVRAVCFSLNPNNEGDLLTCFTYQNVDLIRLRQLSVQCVYIADITKQCVCD